MPTVPDTTWRSILRRRLAVAGAVVALWAIGIEARLVFFQVYQHDTLVARAARQQLRTIEAPAKRGEIFDRRGRLLAYSVDADTIYAVPTDISDVQATVRALCGPLGCAEKERDQLRERLGRARAFVYVKRRVTQAEASGVAALGLDGIGFMKESKRFYPNRELAAHVLGYVGVDNVGLHGVEAAYDSVVRGRAGTVLVQTDARHQAFSRLERTPTSGGALELTLDDQLQFIVERELAATVAQTHADAATAVIMDPRTGEILAMASLPTFNPNDYQASNENAQRNRAVQDLYEPGSTFKIVTASAALEERVTSPETLIDTTGGEIRLGASVVHDTHDYGVLSFSDVIVKSSNVGAIKVGLRLGAERLSLYVNRFGFGRPISGDFPGENPGIVWNPAKLTERAIASVSMGYQVGVTPLQMAAAVSAVANGGTLYEPRLLRAVVRDGVRTRVTPKAVRRAIQPETAATLTTIMEQVVTSGTGRAAQLPGFIVAGKTGTAAKLVNGRYSTTNYNASFVGFVPSRRPVLTIVVVIDTPRVDGHTGGLAAAPVFSRIAQAALRQLGVAPTVNPSPPLLVARRGDPAPHAEIGTVSIVSAPAEPPAPSDPTVIPDLRGQGAREALRTLARLGIVAHLRGAGVVQEQDPPAGTPVESGMACTLALSRLPVTRALAIAGTQP